ncbi:MAG: uroporphyrinogen decarboxylase family protein [Chloroflexota bacterium]
MNAHDRVLTALHHQEPDRVPIEFGAASTSSIVLGPPYGYDALCGYLGLSDRPTPQLARLFGNSVANPDERILEQFGADLRWIAPDGPDLVEIDASTLWNPNWGYRIISIDGINQPDDASAPLRDATIEDIRKYAHWPNTRDPLLRANKRQEARRHREHGFAVVANPGVGCEIFEPYTRLRGWDTWLLDMRDDPRLYHSLAERILEIDVAVMQEFLPEVAESIDIVFMADDLGTQHGPIMSLDDYRRFCRPYQARWIAEARRLAPHAYVMMHSCGDFYALIPDLIEIGVDILQPVQPKASHMEPWRLKHDFGTALSFMGGLDTQELLPFGTSEEVRAGARALIDEYGAGGGFIFAPSHEILPDAPPENIAAMYGEALAYGRYPLRTSGDRGLAHH